MQPGKSYNAHTRLVKYIYYQLRKNFFHYMAVQKNQTHKKPQPNLK